MNAIVTVVGKDRVGIISEISTLLAKNNINILNVEQTIFENDFSMMMHISLPESLIFKHIKEILKKQQNKLSLEINIYNDEIFNKMHNL